jgi:hypothetical protein
MSTVIKVLFGALSICAIVVILDSSYSGASTAVDRVRWHETRWPSGVLKEQGGEYRIIDVQTDYPLWGKIGVWKQWHENGSLQSQGQWWPSPPSLNPSYRRVGQWRYYTTDGLIERLISYSTDVHLAHTDDEVFDGPQVFWTSQHEVNREASGVFASGVFQRRLREDELRYFEGLGRISSDF